MTKELADTELLRSIARHRKAVSLSLTDCAGNIEAEVYLAYIMYIPTADSYIAYWDPSDCSKKDTCGHKPSQVPEDKNSWSLRSMYGSALYRNLKILDTYCLGGL